jgi:tryptophanyl-tRNA synthetase
MSLRDATKKMSKSDPSELSRISITDSSDSIRDKITRAKTDLTIGVTNDPDNRPEVANLVSLFSAMSGRSVEDICSQYANTDLLAFKKGLIDVTVSELEPIRKEYLRLMSDISYLDSVLQQGGDRAHADASETLRQVRGAAGLL